jgi:hypothetical protein
MQALLELCRALKKAERQISTDPARIVTYSSARIALDVRRICHFTKDISATPRL